MRKLWILSVLFFGLLWAEDEPLVLVRGGKSAYVIMVPDKSSAQNNRAASLLKLQLQAATGADLTIVNEKNRRNRDAVFVGPVETAAQAGTDPAKAPPVFFRGKDIFIGANPKADPQRAAGIFLLKHCGLAWNRNPKLGNPSIAELKVSRSGTAVRRETAARHDTDTLPLCREGRPLYVIIVPVKTTREINQAASELAKHLNAATGAKFTIVDERALRGRKALFVGPGPLAEKVFQAPPSGIMFREGNVWITAGKTRKLLENVYRFLEDNCRIPRGIHRGKKVTPRPDLLMEIRRDAPEGALVISEDAQTRYVIVLPEKKKPSLETAAGELASHLKLMTGADFPVIGEERHRGEPAFFIGPVRAAEKVFPDPLFSGAKPDTVAVKFRNRDIFLNGKADSGPLYAVYTLLEDYCGVRWWTQGEAYIPKYRTFGVVPRDLLYSPVLISRGAFYRAASGIQAARNKANDFFSYVPDGYGNRMRVIGKVHTFNQFMPPAKYFDEHPEYFPLIGGKRRKGNDYQLCLTNREMTAEFTKICLRKIAENPDYPIISVSMNDSDKKIPCECPACSAVMKEDNASGLYLRFVNRVAAGIREKYPHMLVQTLAYHETLVPPKKTVPADNVVILFCPIGADYAQSLETGKNNENIRSCLRGWSRISPKIFIWNYVANFKNYVYPHPNWRHLAGDLRFFIKNNAIGIFEQGDFGCSIGDFVRPRAWVLQKLLWDPARDEKKLAEEFFSGYYGPAGPGLLKYIRFMCDTLEKSGAKLPTVYTTPDFWLTCEDIVEARKICAEAEKTVAGLPVFSERVRRDRLSLDYAYLNAVAAKLKRDRIKGVPSGEDRTKIMALAEEFIRESARWKPIQFREHVPFAGHAEQLRDKLAAAFDIPAEKIARIAPAVKKTGVLWDHLSPAFFIHYRVGNWCFYENDPAALTGKTVRMPNTHKNWAYQGTLGKEYAASGKKWIFKAEVRCDAAVDTGKALSFGLYDTKNKKNIYTRTVAVSECRGKNYVFIETPPVALGEEQLFWCAPEQRRPSEVSNVFISSVVMYTAEK